MYKRQFRATNFKLSDALANYADKKLNKLDRFFKDNEDVLIKVKFTVLPHKSFKAAIELNINNNFIDKSVAIDNDMYIALNTAVKQIKDDLHHKSDRNTTLRKFNKKVNFIENE